MISGQWTVVPHQFLEVYFCKSTSLAWSGCRVTCRLIARYSGSAPATMLIILTTGLTFPWLHSVIVNPGQAGYTQVFGNHCSRFLLPGCPSNIMKALNDNLCMCKNMLLWFLWKWPIFQSRFRLGRSVAYLEIWKGGGCPGGTFQVYIFRNVQILAYFFALKISTEFFFTSKGGRGACASPWGWSPKIKL